MTGFCYYTFVKFLLTVLLIVIYANFSIFLKLLSVDFGKFKEICSIFHASLLSYVKTIHGQQHRYNLYNIQKFLKCLMLMLSYNILLLQQVCLNNIFHNLIRHQRILIIAYKSFLHAVDIDNDWDLHVLYNEGRSPQNTVI